MHFYHLHALDWVDIVNALKADPKKAAELAQSFSKWDKNTPAYFTRCAGQDQGSSPPAGWASSPTATGDIRLTSCRRK